MAQVETFDVFKADRYEATGSGIKKYSTSSGCAYGKTIVNSGKHEWEVKYEQDGDHCCLFIGIATHSDQLASNPNSTKTTIGYYIASKSGYRLNTNASTQQQSIAQKIASGDVVRIVLDYDSKSVVVYKQDVELFTCNNIPTGADTSYRLCVFSDKKDKFTIIKSAGNNVDISLQAATIALNQINESIQTANDRLKEMSMSDLTTLKEQTTTFMNECKEFEQTFENVKTAINALDEKVDKEMKPNAKNYKEWKPQEICRYILSLENQRFPKYIESLQGALEKQAISGQDLPEIEANDLYTMGIENFGDRKALAKYLKNLGNQEGDIATQNL